MQRLKPSSEKARKRASHTVDALVPGVNAGPNTASRKAP